MRLEFFEIFITMVDDETKFLRKTLMQKCRAVTFCEKQKNKDDEELAQPAYKPQIKVDTLRSTGKKKTGSLFKSMLGSSGKEEEQHEKIDQMPGFKKK